MLWILLAALASGLLIGQYLKEYFKDRKYRYLFGDVLLPALGTLFVAAIIATFLNLIGSFFVDTEYEKGGSAELVSLSDGTSIGGGFFIGTGTFNGYDVFRFYTKDSNGGMHLNTTYAYDGTVYEILDPKDKTQVPHIDYHYKHSANKWVSLFAKGDDRLEVFVVPQGSVKKDFTLDTKE